MAVPVFQTFQFSWHFSLLSFMRSLLFLKLWLTKLAHQVGPTILPDDKTEKRCLCRTTRRTALCWLRQSGGFFRKGKDSVYRQRQCIHYRPHCVLEVSRYTRGMGRGPAWRYLSICEGKKKKQRPKQAAVNSRTRRDSAPRPWGTGFTVWSGRTTESRTWCRWTELAITDWCDPGTGPEWLCLHQGLRKRPPSRDRCVDSAA